MLLNLLDVEEVETQLEIRVFLLILLFESTNFNLFNMDTFSTGKWCKTHSMGFGCLGCRGRMNKKEILNMEKIVRISGYFTI
jgi:hypothetical protein